MNMTSNTLYFLEQLENKTGKEVQVFKQTKEVVSFLDIFQEILDFQGHTHLKTLCLTDVPNNHMAGDLLLEYVEKNIELFEKGHTMFFSQQGEEYTVVCVRIFKSSSKVLLKFFDLFEDTCPIALKDSYRIIVRSGLNR